MAVSTKKEYIMTIEEYNNLKDQVDILKNDKRREIAERINQARGYGDLSENAEYDAAKNEQAENEETIHELDEMIKFAKIIEDDKIDTSAVSIGVKVRVLDCEINKEVEYIITGSRGADPFNNKISNESPIALALIGKKVGEEAVIDTPSGQFVFKILDIDKTKQH